VASIRLALFGLLHGLLPFCLRRGLIEAVLALAIDAVLAHAKTLAIPVRNEMRGKVGGVSI